LRWHTDHTGTSVILAGMFPAGSSATPYQGYYFRILKS
jgi:hypothetical protein